MLLWEAAPDGSSGMPRLPHFACEFPSIIEGSCLLQVLFSHFKVFFALKE
jgi:hypothetical protein